MAIREAHVPAVVAAFPRPRFYVDEGAVREAIRFSGMFNVIDTSEGDKVDFWMLTDEPVAAPLALRRFLAPHVGHP